jgi:rubrerythrin
MDRLKLDDLWARVKAESKLNREMTKLRDDMEKSRCNECGFTGYTHQEWCPKGKLK